MILSDVTIREYIASEKIIILPEFDNSDIRPTGIRLHLGSEILVPHADQVVDPCEATEIEYDEIAIPNEGYILTPGIFVLGATYERIMTPRNIVCHLEGRSTIARLGLSVHCTSGIIDGNYDELRTIVLEMKNQGPFQLRLRAKMPLAMLIFNELSHPIAQQPQSQYKGQTSVMPPNLKFRKGDM